MINLDIKSSHRKIPLLDKIGYGAGNFSTGVSIQVVSSYLVFYCTTILNIPGSLVGIAVSIGVFWDALTDPLMGYISDRTKSKFFGRRHLYLLIGGIGIGIANLILWDIDRNLSTTAKFLIILIDSLAIKTFMTIFTTPYTALGAELSNDYNERTSIQSIKTIFFLIGMAFVVVLGLALFFKPTAEFPTGQLNPHGYRSMGLYSSIIIVVFALICFFSTKKYIPYINQAVDDDSNSGKLKTMLLSFREVLKNPQFRAVAFTYMFTNIVSALLTGLGLHVFTFTFKLHSQQIAVILGVLIGFSMLSQPFWISISKKIDKKPSLILGILLCIVACSMFLLITFFKDSVSGNIIVFLPFSALAGFGMGGLLSLPLSMIADIIDLDELNKGIRSEGVYYGCLTFLYKCAQSIALLSVGFLLDIIGFNANLPIQTESTLIILGLILSIGAIISFGLSYLSLKSYDLDRSRIQLIQSQIANKKIN